MHNNIFDNSKFDNTDMNTDTKFDIEWHLLNHKDNLEVCVDEKGEIFYSRPSHIAFLTRKCCERLNVDESKLKSLCPHFNYKMLIKWLCEKSGMIAVWRDFYIGEPNEVQLKVLKDLEKSGLFTNSGKSFFN